MIRGPQTKRDCQPTPWNKHREGSGLAMINVSGTTTHVRSEHPLREVEAL